MTDREAFERCIRGGGVAVFPADTVYGLACDPGDADAIRRLYALKGRDDGKPAALMFFDRERALADVTLGPRTRRLAEALLPGGVTLLVAPDDAAMARWPRAAAGGRLGVRVPAPGPLAGAHVVVLQSSANHAGEPAATRLEEIPADIRAGADLVVDAGPLPGTASTVVDLAVYEADGTYAIVRPGAVAEAEIAAAATGVRDARAEDLDAVLALYGQLHADDPPLPPGVAAARFAAITATPGLRLLVLEDGGAVAATLVLAIVPNLTRGGRPYALVENVVVDAARRGRGLGRRLMGAALALAREAGCYKVMLLTGSTDPATHAFYRACGFDGDAKTGYVTTS